MTVVTVESSRQSQHPFTGRARWTAAAILIIGPLLQAVEFLIGTEPAGADPAARVNYWSQNEAAVGLSITAGLLATPFLIAGFGALAVLAASDSRRLSWAAAALLTVAMTSLAAVHGVLIAAYWLVLADEGPSAITLMASASADVGLPGIVLFATFLGCATVGLLTMVACLWRSRFVPRVVPFLFLAFFVLDFALAQGVIGHLVGLAAFAVVAWAVLTDYERRRAAPPPP